MCIHRKKYIQKKYKRTTKYHRENKTNGNFTTKYFDNGTQKNQRAFTQFSTQKIFLRENSNILDEFVMHYIYDTANGILRGVTAEMDVSHTVQNTKLVLQQVTGIPLNRQILLDATGKILTLGVQILEN